MSLSEKRRWVEIRSASPFTRMVWPRMGVIAGSGTRVRADRPVAFTKIASSSSVGVEVSCPASSTAPVIPPSVGRVARIVRPPQARMRFRRYWVCFSGLNVKDVYTIPSFEDGGRDVWGREVKFGTCGAHQRFWGELSFRGRRSGEEREFLDLG